MMRIFFAFKEAKTRGCRIREVSDETKRNAVGVCFAERGEKLGEDDKAPDERMSGELECAGV